jgi:hypothetical protein
MKLSNILKIAVSAVAGAGLLLQAAGCTWGGVSDGNSNTNLGHATISYRSVDMSVSTFGSPPTQSAAGVATTWANSDPGSGGNSQGIFYLNPYGHLNAGDNTNDFGGFGWVRAYVSQPGYDSRVMYKNHAFGSCNIPTGQGPYSAGPYPYVTSGATTSGVCAYDSFTLYPSNVDYTLHPDVIIDERTLRDNQVATGTQCEGVASRCLRVSVGTPNVGQGDLWLQGNSNTPGVTQREYTRNGHTIDSPLPNAVFLYHPSHGHIHLQNWTNLRLRQVLPNCNTEATATNCPVVGVPGQKISFCLTELGTFDSSLTPNPVRASGCSWDSATGAINQGIGAGREDVYSKGLADQLIGIDGLGSGTYWLEVEVNPANTNGQRTVLESDYTNNITRIQVNL